MLRSVLSVFLIFILPFVMAHWSKRHKEVARRAQGDVNIYKRQYYANERFTWYDVGLGACGVESTKDQFVVALSWENYGSGYPGPNCFKSIVIQYGGLTAGATIVDECMGCPYGGLDFSEGLFAYFANTGTGVISGTWWYGDAQTSTTTWEQPTSTPAYTPWPTTAATTTYVPSPTTSSTPAYTSPVNSMTTTSSTTSSTSTSRSSGLPAPTGVVPTPNTTNPENILLIYEIMVELGIMLTMAEECG